MACAYLHTENIGDWASFHTVCKEAFGFPDFYGENMNAWIDCLSYLYEDDGMSHFHLANGEMLFVEVTDTKRFNERVPEIFDALVEGSASVNFRYEQPVLALIFTDRR